MCAEDALATRYAARLLESLGISPAQPLALAPEHPAVACAASGLMWLTGRADGPPVFCPAPLAACADGALEALRVLSAGRLPPPLRGAQLLGERAAIAGLRRRGAISPGGACRLLESADGAIAASLVRRDDWTFVPAWLEESPDDWDWESLAVAARWRTTAELVERGRLLGLAVAPVEAPRRGAGWLRRLHGRAPRPATTALAARERGPLVVDLSALWAGPLCAQLLQSCGAHVIKIESTSRPDGAREGPAQFYDLLNAGKASVALDLDSAQGRERLRRLCLQADIVIEASRPRALRQLGIGAEALLASNPRLTWLSITGYGRAEPQGSWIAYGDDAGAAGGLIWQLREVAGTPLFCGDAIADPLTAVHAALAAWAGFLAGGGQLLSVALRDVVAHCASFETPSTGAGLRRRQREWLAALAAAGVEPSPPRARAPAGRAQALGADNGVVLRTLLAG